MAEVTCPHCAATFANKWNLQRHERRGTCRRDAPRALIRKTCVVCSTQFDGCRTSGKWPALCGSRCRGRLIASRRKSDAPSPPQAPVVSLDSAFDVPGKWIVCYLCGATASQNQRGGARRYCTKRCAKLAEKERRRERVAAGVSWIESNVAACCGWCFGPMPDMRGQKGSPFYKFCSDSCQYDNARHVATHPAGRCDIQWYSCELCGWFFHSYKSHSRWCSSRCAQRATRKRKNIPKPVRRFVIERDRMRCHLCGKKIRGETPTLDHLVPVSDGGSDDPENLALAHRSCNSKRGATGAAQLRLIA